MTSRSAVRSPQAARTRRHLTVAALAVTAAFVVLAPLAGPAPLLVPLTLLFVGVVPGWAVVAHLRLDGLALELAAAVALSLAVATLVSTALVYGGVWNPLAAAHVLALLASASLLVHLRRAERPGRRRAGPSSP